MTYLRTQNRIQPVTRSDGKRYYKIEFDLVMTVNGRSLRYEAFHPHGNKGILQTGSQTCIAAAFIPGTA